MMISFEMPNSVFILLGSEAVPSIIAAVEILFFLASIRCWSSSVFGFPPTPWDISEMKRMISFSCNAVLL